jgi:uncharacterized protein (DUF1501 family)
MSNRSITTLNRRDFLRRALYTTMAAGISSSMPLRLAAMDCQVSDMPRTLVNVMLHGGADLRYLFMPAPNHANQNYVNLTWAARRSLYSSEYATYGEMFADQYLLTADPLGGPSFGVHRSAAWLGQQIEMGQAAVISNAYCSRNRRHDQSILNADSGKPELEVLNFDTSGWGGRLVEQLGAARNSVELGNSVSTFNKGSSQGERLARVVHARDMRDMALALPNEGNATSNRNVLARALQSWYEARGAEVALEKPSQWPYHVFFQHYQAVNQFGAAVEERLSACQPLPEELLNLNLSSADFAQQCRNLFDACQVPDVLGTGVMSMSYGGWDTHDNQANEAGSNLADLFAVGGGLDTALSGIDQLPSLERQTRDQLVFYFASDFGRQIVANGSAGTDHGRGTYSLLLGAPVRGGVYGEMFPARESMPDADGRVPLQTPGADIEGLTSTDRILSRASDWVQPGSGAEVFPDAASAALEPGVDLSRLLA